MKIINWIKYWRASLADAESINVDISRLDSKYKPETFDPKENKLSAELFQVFWPEEELKALQEGQVLDKEILISPLSLVPGLSHTKAKSNEEEIAPFWISASISSMNELKPGNKKYPLIPRKILEPVAKKDIVFSSVDKVDEVLAKSEINTENWEAYYNSMEQVFLSITGEEITAFQPQEYFEVKLQWVVMPDEQIIGASFHILELYNKLSRESKYPKLFKAIIEEKNPAIQPQYSKREVFEKSADHLGQMNNGFGLSPSQRKALCHFTELNNGEVLAVNGPPGTGKTTLIQSVIADNLIKAAARGKNPMVTVASSTNNQAITNIIDSFSKSKASTLFEERWLDGVGSFALYMVSSDPKKIKNSKEKGWLYHTAKKAESSLSELETITYVTAAKVRFLHQLNTFSGLSITNLVTAKDYLQDQIRKHSETIKEGILQWKNFVSIKETLQEYAPYTDQELFHVSSAFFEKETAEISIWISKLLEAQQKEPFYFFFSFIKAIKARKYLYYQLVFHGCSFDTSSWDFSSSAGLQSALLKKAGLIKAAYQKFTTFHSWKEHIPAFKNETFAVTDSGASFLSKVDTAVRYRNFYYAVHYWEARWIEATEKAIKEDSNWKNTETGTIERMQRFAMLCPCFVSTFHMLPKMMQYTEYPSKETNYLFSFVDLLIVDEAGQVSPEVGVPSFIFAKKALVVGDNYQIEPVWNVDGKTDEGNLLQHKLYKQGEKKRMEELVQKGYLSSSGSLMKLAQKSCYFEFKTSERGLLLTEHRRCLDQIIGYCNELVYDNQLEPMSSLKYESSDLLPPMGYLQINGQSEKVGGSRSNRIEAEKIVAWLKINEEQIIDWIYCKEQQESKSPKDVKKKKLHDLVGIVTPFAAHKRHLTRALALNGYNAASFQYGTVHSLQGAEKDIVLFSPVYTADLKTGYFFDMGPNMLNVAVSRAKRSFIVAGDRKVFSKGSKKVPSGLLGTYLKDEVK
jgi:Cdc6-like AAA superfamily ATPase